MSDQASEHPKKRRPLWIVLWAIFLSLPLVLLVSGDRNPLATYDPTDGMVLVQSISKHLDEDAGPSRLQPDGLTTSVKSPAQFVNYPKDKIESGKVFVIEYVEYKKGYPKLIRKIGSWINRPYNPSDVSICAIGVDSEGVYFESERADGGGGGYSMLFAELDLKPFIELRKGAKRLSDNSKVRCCDSFYVVQLGKDIRVYSPEELPPEMRDAASKLRDEESFKKTVHMVGQ